VLLLYFVLFDFSFSFFILDKFMNVPVKLCIFVNMPLRIFNMMLLLLFFYMSAKGERETGNDVIKIKSMEARLVNFLLQEAYVRETLYLLFYLSWVRRLFLVFFFGKNLMIFLKVSELLVIVLRSLISYLRMILFSLQKLLLWRS
jgi:hypothetical protein